MIIVELPIIYALNYEEAEKAKDSGIEIEIEEDVSMTTFYIPDNIYLRINPAKIKDRTTLFFNDNDNYQIGADYETVRDIFNKAIKKS